MSVIYDWSNDLFVIDRSFSVKITVEHEVSPDKNFCTYGGDFWGKDLCQYHTHRDRTHGRKAPIERKVPKCTLFGTWLDKPYQKCKECILTCEQEERMEE